MRIEHLTSHLNFNSSPHMQRTKSRAFKEAEDVAEHKNAKRNSNINRPARSVNFSGSASFDTQKIIKTALRELVEEGSKDFKGVKDAPQWAVNFIKSDRMSKFGINPEYAKLIDPKWEDIIVGKAKDGKDIMGGYLADAYSTFYKKVADLAVTPTKAKITIAFMPYLLNALFGKKNKEKKGQVEQIQNIQQTRQIQLNENEQVFKQFTGGAVR